MKHIYLFNEGSVAAIYGIGTYVRQVNECLKNHPDVQLNVVQLYSDEQAFKIIESEGIRTYYFPNIQFSKKSESNRFKYYRNCWYLLKEDVPVALSDKLYFHFNYDQEYLLTELIKKQFPESSILYTIHCQDWCFKLNGNTSRFKRLIYTDKSLINDLKEKQVIEQYETERKMFQSADHLICLADFTKNLLMEEYRVSAEKLSLIYNGLKDEARDFGGRAEVQKKDFEGFENFLQLKRNLFIGKKTKVILFVGRLSEIKGLEFLICAFKTVLKQEPDAHLIIAGSGAFSAYLKEAKGYRHKITFTGRVEKEELYTFYQIADIGVMPSLHEQCSYVAIEMMMHGVPLVASTSTGLCEMVEDGVTGLHVPVEEFPDRVEIRPDALAEKILYLLQHPEERERMGKNARRRYEIVYSPEVMSEKMIGLYGDLG